MKICFEIQDTSYTLPPKTSKRRHEPYCGSLLCNEWPGQKHCFSANSHLCISNNTHSCCCRMEIYYFRTHDKKLLQRHILSCGNLSLKRLASLVWDSFKALATGFSTSTPKKKKHHVFYRNHKPVWYSAPNTHASVPMRYATAGIWLQVEASFLSLLQSLVILFDTWTEYLYKSWSTWCRWASFTVSPNQMA